MTVNKEMMERYCAELETTTVPQAYGQLVKFDEGTACALGIGALMINPNLRSDYSAPVYDTLEEFLTQLGTPRPGGDLDIYLDNGDHVTYLNDVARLPFFTIAQRLRETYLKEES